jgi:hypothetical protein
VRRHTFGMGIFELEALGETFGTRVDSSNHTSHMIRCQRKRASLVPIHPHARAGAGRVSGV